MIKSLKQEPETFDIDSLPIGIEELAKERGKRIGLRKGKEIWLTGGERIALSMLKDNLPISKIGSVYETT